MDQKIDAFARMIVLENGKTFKEAIGEMRHYRPLQLPRHDPVLVFALCRGHRQHRHCQTIGANAIDHENGGRVDRAGGLSSRRYQRDQYGLSVYLRRRSQAFPPRGDSGQF